MVESHLIQNFRTTLIPLVTALIFRAKPVLKSSQIFRAPSTVLLIVLLKPSPKLLALSTVPSQISLNFFLESF